MEKVWTTYVIFSVELVEERLQRQLAGDLVVDGLQVEVVELVGGVASLVDVDHQVAPVLRHTAAAKSGQM